MQWYVSGIKNTKTLGISIRNDRTDTPLQESSELYSDRIDTVLYSPETFARVLRIGQPFENARLNGADNWNGFSAPGVRDWLHFALDGETETFVEELK